MTYPQPAGDVELKFEFPVSTSPTGIELVFGATVIPAEPQDFIPSPDITSTEFGDATVRDPRTLVPGFLATEFGATAVELGTPVILVDGWDSLEFGEVYIAEKPAPTQVSFNSDTPGISGVDGFESGTADVAHHLRYLYVEYSPQEEWGTAFIGDRYRYIYADGVYDGGLGTPEVTHPKQLLPPGLDATQYGDAEVDFHNVAFPTGVATGATDQPFVAFRIRTVTFSGSQYIEWGDNEVDLWQKYLGVYHPPESEATGETFGQYTTVLNRNKTIGVVGPLSQRFGSSPADVALTGRAILPPSIDDGAFGPGTFASYRIRYMRVPGYELDRYPNNTTAYNYAATTRANSLDSFVTGTPAVDKLLKFTYPAGYRMDGYGHPWASFSPRSVRPVALDSFAKSNTHYVSTSPYLVQCAGLHNLRTGAPFVYARPPITVYPTWGQLWVQDWKQMGIPAVRRYPPLIEVPGRPYTDFSHPAAFVSFRVRTLQPPSVDGQEVWGTHVVRDRAFTIRVDGVRSDWYENNFTVENALNIIVPSTQYFAASEFAEMTEYGRHAIQQRWINVMSVEGLPQFGETVVQANMILFEPRHHPSTTQGATQFGLAHIPGAQIVVPKRLTPLEFGVNKMNPRYVFCAVDALPTFPREYIVRYQLNLHEGAYSMAWGGDEFTLLGAFGEVDIIHKRTVYVVVNPSTEYVHKPGYGQPTMYYGTQEVFPPSFNSFRSGATQLRPYPQELGPKGLLYTQFGRPTLPPDSPAPYLYPPGLETGEWGQNEVTNFYRHVFMEGALHEVLVADVMNPSHNGLGYPIVGDWLRVFPSYDATVFGANNVMNWIRYVYPEPKESDWGDIFVVREKQHIYLKGEDETAFGVFDNTREHFVRPYSVQFFCSTSPHTQVLHA